MIEKQFVTRSEWKKHVQSDWKKSHNLWSHIKGSVPGWGYSQAEIDAFFEGEASGKKQVHWDRITSKPATYAPSAHTHVKSDITNTPWSWADVSKIGSNLTDLATRQHAGLTNVTSGQHHAKLHASAHHVGGGDLLAFASITGFGDYLDQAVKQASSPTFAGLLIDQSKAEFDFGADKLTLKYTFDDTHYSFIEWKNSVGTRGAYMGWGAPGTKIDLFLEDGNYLDISGGTTKVVSLTIGSYYLNSLIANNKVPDSEKWNGNLFADYLDQAVKTTSDVELKSLQATIFMAYGTVATPDPLYRLKPYGTADISFVRWLDKDGGDEWSIGTQSHQAGWVIRRESGTPANLLVVQRATGIVNIGVNLDTPKLTINGGFYIDTLTANNRINDSDKWGGNAFADYMNQAVKSTSDVEFASVQASIFMAYGIVGSVNALYRLKPYGTSDESFVKYLDNTGSEEWSVGTQSHQASWVVRRESGTPGNMLLVDRATGKVTAAVELVTPKLTIGSYYIDTLSANNRVYDSARLGGTVASSYALTTRPLDTFGATTDITDLDATITKHGLLMKLGGGTTNFLRADGQWGAPTPAAHASAHEVGGGDLVSHDSLTDFVGDKHIDWTAASQVLNTSGGIETPIFMAYGIVGTPAPLYRLKPYGTSDASFVRWLDTGGLSRWSVGTQSHQGSLVIRRESGTPGNVVVVEPGGRVLIPTEVDTAKLTIGSYYIDTLGGANNRVYDSARLGGTVAASYALTSQLHTENHASRHSLGQPDVVNHDNLAGFVGAEHLSLPNSMANVINSGHTKALHDGLGLDHGSLSGRGDDDHTQYLLVSGARTLSAAWDAGAYQIRALKFYSDIVTGTAPFIVNSATKVVNLNACRVDNIHGTSFLRSDVDDNLTAAIIVPDANRDEGIFGTYISTKTQHIWSMGTGYRNSPTGANFGNLYGLAYKYNGVAGGHGVYLVNNGVQKSALGLNVWTSGRFISTIVTGTAPLTVASTTKVTNLNADLLEGYHASSSAGNNTVVLRTASGYIFANFFNTSPNDVVSAVTKVCVETGNDGYIRHGTQAAIRLFIGAGTGNGLDADKVDGEHAAAIVTNARVKLHFPDTIVNVLSNHTKTVHDNMGMDHGSLSGKADDDHSQYFNTTRHTKAVHTTLGLMPYSGGAFTGLVTAKDHGVGNVDELINVCYGTGSPPTASTTTEGTLFIKYIA